MSLYSIGLSGLNAAQSALSNTSNNISNVYTEGYNRQLIQLGESSSGGSMGSGVSVDGIQRQYNSYIGTQLNQANSRQSALETYSQQISQIDDLLADSDSGLNTLMQDFFSSVEDLTGSPSDPAAREGMLGTSQSMVAQFRAYDTYINDMRDGLNGQIDGAVSSLNDLSSQIAGLNKEIGFARAKTGEEPNALLDQRDKLVSQLNDIADVRVTVQDGSNYQVSLSNGLPLVAGSKSFELAARENSADPANLTISYRDGSGNLTPINDSVIKGGEIGGMLSFRNETLDRVQNQLGQLAVSLAGSFNEQHEQGVDLEGREGEAYFELGNPTVFTNRQNAGDASFSARFDDPSAVTADDYRLTSQGGGSFQLENLTSGESSTITATDGKLTFGGVELTLNGTPAQNDTFLVQPTRNAAKGLDVALTDTSKIAAAGGDNGGVGDNRNALALLDLQNQKLVGGKASFSGGFASMVSGVGNRSSITDANLATQTGLSEQLYTYQQADSGVNLDEEYANLMRYQQYFTANAKVIEAGTSVLDTILGIRS
ncbi:flagellar hook-associated protein FlgK [Salinicola aestuarinus]|uniref:flagellar hook-associated protein FlgK n=1 Tax=Salinicola aestuarinus TaxID=1949082 RepID=UPI000DA18146|nr:flagellar hook-associated protein FlgK [Salinicola aestuarinus]